MGWHASLAGEKAEFEPAGEKVVFEFPHHRGTFRGALARDRSSISGFWLQPHGAAGDPRDPDGKGATFAESVVLLRQTDTSWQGTIVPLRDSFTLYLKIFRGGDGAVMAAFRNPEMNFRGGAAQFHVARKGDTVSLIADPAHPDKHLDLNWDEADHALHMHVAEIDREFVLTRATPQEATGFWPRPQGSAPYVYRAPDETQDGWPVARARDEGMDEEKLAGLVQSIVDTDPAAKHPNLIHSLLIARHGKLVLDEYFEGHTQDTPHDVRSAGKTFSSVLLGALMRQGVAISPQTQLYPLVAGMGPFAHPDPRKSEITLAELMTHTSGLACDDNDDASPGNEDRVQSQRDTPDWWKFTLDLPMANDPGARYAYCSPGMNLMGAALTTAAKTDMPELFDREIAQPLQWGPYYWDMMPNGEGYLGGGAFVRPRDLLKLGQAYLDGGVWHGRRIVDAAWVKESTATHVAVSPATTGLAPDRFADFYFPGEDGYAWHIAHLHTPGRDYRAYGAGGNGGQLLIVVPELDLVVAFTGGNYGQGLIWNKWRDELIPSAIIPAIAH
jgi:CubicO group peptidase (beta-lactamase class C family)